MSRYLPVVWLAFGATGCSEHGFGNQLLAPLGPQPEIVVDPPELLFGALASDQVEEQTFTVRNEGEARLDVDGIVLEAGFAFELVGADGAFELEPGESRDIRVSFTPEGTNENYGRAVVLSNDWDEPEVLVDFLGYGALPELHIEPDNFVFGRSVVPCGGAVQLTLSNVGSGTLVIDDFEYSSAGLLSLDEGAYDQLPLTIPPGEAAYVNVDFAPVRTGSDTGKLEVRSNDPRGVVAAYQNGEGFSGDRAEEEFLEPGVTAVDVMLLIDHSCSMSEDNVDDVTNGIPRFMEELRAVSDWQLLEVTEASGCTSTSVIDPHTKNAEQILIDHAWDGNSGAPETEALLGLAGRALDQTGAGGCNEGFLRAGALLHIIAISDEHEQSRVSYEDWLVDYAGHVGSSAFVTVSAVADIHRACGDGSGPGGYLEAAEATGGSVLDICDASWGSMFGEIASTPLAGIRTYNLTQQAVDGSVEVYVNDELTTDITYGFDTNSVTVHSPPIGEGDVVRVTYILGEECR